MFFMMLFNCFFSYWWSTWLSFTQNFTSIIWFPFLISILVIRIFSGRINSENTIINIKLYISSFQRHFSLFVILKCKMDWIWVLLYIVVITMFKRIFEINIFKVTLSWLILYSKFSKVTILTFQSLNLLSLTSFMFISLMILHISINPLYIFLLFVIIILSIFLHILSMFLFSWHLWRVIDILKF